MSGSMDPGRRFTEQEVDLILKRAAELQHREPLAPAEAEREGLSLADLQQIAAEAGIDPRLVRQAAATLDIRPATRGWTVLLGAPAAIQLERVMDSEVPVGHFEELVEVIRRGTGIVGQASTLGRTLTWHSGNYQRPVQVTVIPRDGRTMVRVEERLGNVAGGLFGGIVGGLGGGGGGAAIGVLGGALGSITAGLSVAGVVLVGSYLLARGIYTTIVRTRTQQLARLTDQLTDSISEATRGERR